MSSLTVNQLLTVFK